MRLLGIALRLSVIFAAVSAPALAQPAPERVRYDDHKLVHVTLTSQQDIEAVLRISGDFWSERVGIGVVPFRIAPENMAALEESGLDFEIVHQNVQALIDRQRPARPAEPAAWFDDFKTYDEVNTYIDTLVAQRPDLVTKLALGQSLHGRTIYGMRISSAPVESENPAVLFNGTQHAREWITPMVNMYIANRLVEMYDTDPDVQALVDDVVFYIVPIVNTDGYVYSWDVERLWRKNRRDSGGGCFGVDNNRNWGFHWGDDASSSSDPCNIVYRGTGPFSEPENQVVRDFILGQPRILAHFDFHSYGQDIFSQYGEVAGEPPEPDRTTFRTLNAQMAAAILAVHGQTYRATPSGSYLSGGFAVWTYNDQGILSWTVELRDNGTFGFLLPADQILPTCEENFEAVKVLAEYIAVPFTFSFPDGLPARVPPDSETTVSLMIAETSGTLDPATPRLLSRVGTSGSFLPTNLIPLGGASFEAVLPAAPCGSTIHYYFRARSTSGTVRTSPEEAPETLYEVDAVETTLLMSDDMEADLGWTVGDVVDDATTGVWVRVDPNGTAAQPEDDHTAAGTLCWATGQGTPGGDLGENDVDGGKTTLSSPVLDLSDGDALISYWRWYSNDTGNAPNADIFTVDVTDDGGSTWTNAETVGPSGPGTSGGWVYHEFRVSDWVAPTAQVQVRFVASDEADGSLVEAAIDDLSVYHLECGPQPLAFQAEGPRYLTARPPSPAAQIALRLESPDYPCLSMYVAADGRLVGSPVLQSPLEWGTVPIHGVEIAPSTAYRLQPEDGVGADVGAPAEATTARWGDVAGEFVSGQWERPDGNVDFEDITATVDRFRQLPGAPPLERCDVAPAVPNGAIDFDDIAAVVDAFRELPYPYGEPCP